MKIVESMVKTYAWIKLTSTSISSMNTEKSRLMTVAPPPAAGLTAAKMKMSSVSTSTIMCPPIMLAKRRTVRAAGLVNMPKISMAGMMGRGNFSHRGTSGHNISFQ